MIAPRLIGCHECDLLQRETDLPDGGTACCARCGAVLYRRRPRTFDRALVYAVTAAILFVIGNSFPVLGLEMNGDTIETTLYSAGRSLYDQDSRFVAVLVWVTTIVMPGLDIAAMLYLLLPLRLGRRPPGVVPVFRLLHAVRPWGMVEVFILGVLVTLVKLAHLAHAIPGIALASLSLLMFAIAAAASSFDDHEFWLRLDRLGAGVPAGPPAAGAEARP